MLSIIVLRKKIRIGHENCYWCISKHDFIIVHLTLFLKYYDVNLIYLAIYLRRINGSNLRWPLGILKNKNLNLTNIKCSNHISELNE